MNSEKLSSERQRLVTGDRPTGNLHLGHWIGSIQNRLLLQDKYDCFFLIADLHSLTTKISKNELCLLEHNIKNVVLDWLSLGLDPKKSTIYLQSSIPQTYELYLLLSMLTSLNKLTGLPSIKDMAKQAKIDDSSVSLGLISYPVLQSSDILLLKAHVVPIGKDNESHLELTRDIARKINNNYKNIFPLPKTLLSSFPVLIGLDGFNKMSKSANNAIFFTDSPEEVKKKVFMMYTDPNRIRADIPGKIKNNPLFIFHDIFNPNLDEVKDFKERYSQGKIKDVEVKTRLAEAINIFLEPIREKRALLEKQGDLIPNILNDGRNKLIPMATQTLEEVKEALGFSTKNIISSII